jgi:predicted component of type VI protein secretion system
MGENNWRELCEQIMKESDPEKLMELVEELNQALEAREEELRNLTRTNLPKRGYRAGT